MHADPHAHRVRAQPATVGAEPLLHVEGGAQRVGRPAEHDHEAVALGLHDLAVVLLDRRPHDLVVPGEHLDERSVTQRHVELGGALDVGEEHRDGAVRRGGPLDDGAVGAQPLSEVLDRARHERLHAVGAEQVGRLGHGLDGMRRPPQRTRRTPAVRGSRDDEPLLLELRDRRPGVPQPRAQHQRDDTEPDRAGHEEAEQHREPDHPRIVASPPPDPDLLAYPPNVVLGTVDLSANLGTSFSRCCGGRRRCR